MKPAAEGKPNIWARLKGNFRCIKEGEPGCRFLGCYKYKQQMRGRFGKVSKTLDIVLGIAVIVVGLVMMPAPGPGWPIIAVGLALLAGEFESVARWLDRGELSARMFVRRVKRTWMTASVAVKSGLALVLASAAGALGYATYLIVQLILG